MMLRCDADADGMMMRADAAPRTSLRADARCHAAMPLRAAADVDDDIARFSPI